MFDAKVKANAEKFDFPINKKIIGKNQNLEMRASLETPEYHMALWAHKTYILDNEPLGGMNKSLPKEFFKFASPEGFAKKFVSTYKSSSAHNNENENIM